MKEWGIISRRRMNSSSSRRACDAGQLTRLAVGLGISCRHVRLHNESGVPFADAARSFNLIFLNLDAGSDRGND
jgi:hypothetical protein